jgi:hypothetical protein
MPQAEEQVVLEELELQLVDLENLPRFQSLLRRHHYLGAIKPVGERLYYAARWHGQWLALLVFCAAAKHLRHREKWIGWTEEQRRKRLGLVVNNARFLVLPHWSLPNLATKVMGLCAQRLSADWQARYGHPVWLAESFVDTQLFRGTAYKASGWTELGPTQGYGRCGQDYYVKHDRPKALFVKELKRKARRSLCAEHLPELVARAVESKVPPRPTQRVGELRSLREHFARVPDFRGRVESYPLSSVLAMVACAHLCGAPRGHRDLKAFARRFTQAQRRALGVRRDKRGHHPAPSKATFGRVLCAVDPLRVEAALLDWQSQVRGPAPQNQLLAADGKELRHGARRASGHADPSAEPILSRQPVGGNQVQRNSRGAGVAGAHGSRRGVDRHRRPAHPAGDGTASRAGGRGRLFVDGQGQPKRTAPDTRPTAAPTGAAFSPLRRPCRPIGRTPCIGAFKTPSGPRPPCAISMKKWAWNISTAPSPWSTPRNPQP